MKKALCLIIAILTLFTLFSASCGNGDTLLSDTLDNYSALNNPNPSAAAKALFELLQSVYGVKTFTGQYVNVFENPDNYGGDIFNIAEIQAVTSVTDKYPAVIGLDITRVESGGADHVVKLAEDYYNAGGIVTMCWHWFAPEGEDTRGSFYTSDTDFNLAAALADKTSTGYARLTADIAAAAALLLRLQQAGVPVLWRPLHEASGEWFWWGASGADAYLELYRLIYDTFTNVYGLNNLIWVWNGQSNSWYVGDEYCDIVSMDPYPSDIMYNMNPSMSTKFFKIAQIPTTSKMVAMSENGYLPDLDEMFEKGATWLTNGTWCYEYVCKKDSFGNFTGEYSELYNSSEKLFSYYSDPRTITLDELSNLNGVLILAGS